MANIITIGLDEVGRGALAGAVVTGAVSFEKKFRINDKRLPVRIDDSKKLTEKQREDAAAWIYENAISIGIGQGSVKKINKAGIVKATNFAFRSAFNECQEKTGSSVTSVFIDAFYIPRLGNIKKSEQKPIIHGDSLIFEIAAASIVAKVYRDNLMKKLSLRSGGKYKKYLWGQNKGYGTAKHLEAIKTYGVTRHHRTLYVRDLI